jgi:hypothetical protein
MAPGARNDGIARHTGCVTNAKPGPKSVPGPGLRLRRAVLASGGGGALYIDTLKNNRARTVPLVVDLVPIVDRWSAGNAPDSWLFDAPEGGPLRSRTGSGRWAGVLPPWRPGSPGSGSMICAIMRTAGLCALR